MTWDINVFKIDMRHKEPPSRGPLVGLCDPRLLPEIKDRKGRSEVLLVLISADDILFKMMDLH